jgi:hypothetical protein
MVVRLAEADLYASLASPGTRVCDAVGVAFKPECREGPGKVFYYGLMRAWRTPTSSALSGTDAGSDRNAGVEKAQPKSDCHERCNRGNDLQS